MFRECKYDYGRQIIKPPFSNHAFQILQFSKLLIARFKRHACRSVGSRKINLSDMRSICYAFRSISITETAKCMSSLVPKAPADFAFAFPRVPWGCGERESMGDRYKAVKSLCIVLRRCIKTQRVNELSQWAVLLNTVLIVFCSSSSWWISSAVQFREIFKRNRHSSRREFCSLGS